MRIPAGFHRQAGAYAPGYLRWSPVARPIRRLPIQLYRQRIASIPLVGGQAQGIIGGATGSGSLALIQSKAGNTTSGTTLTITLASATTAGNCLVVCIGTVQGTTNPTVSGITLGGSTDHFASAESINNNADTNCEIWADPNCAGGQTSVVITFTGGSGVNAGMAAWVMEWSGLATASAVDQANGTASGVSTSWSSGSTGTLALASEVAFGAVSAAGGTGVTITGPSSPWTNLAQQNAGTNVALLAGYQITTTTAGLAYAGSFNTGKVNAAAIATLKTAVQAGTPGALTLSIGPAGFGNVWHPASVTIQTASGINDSSTCLIYLGPAGTGITLQATLFPGGLGTASLAIPSMTPGQYIIAVWSGGNPGDVASMNVTGVMDSVMPG